MGSNINIYTIMFNRTTTVLCNINLSIDHNLRSIWNLCRVHRNRTVCRSNHPCRSNAICPRATTNTAGTIMSNLKGSQRNQWRIWRHSYRSTHLHSIYSLPFWSSYAIHSLCKNAFTFTFMNCSCFFTVYFSDLWLLCFLLCSCILQNTGRNISNDSFSILFFIVNLTPDAIYCSQALHFILLNDLTYYLSILLSRIIQNITVLQCCKSSLCLSNLITVIDMFCGHIATDLFRTLFALFLISHFTPAIITYGHSLYTGTKIHSYKLLSAFPRHRAYISCLCRNRNLIRLGNCRYLLSTSIINLKCLRYLIILLISINCPLIIQNIRRNCCW